MRVVALCPFLPHPGVGHAGGEYLFRHLEHVSRDHQVTVVGLRSAESVRVAAQVPPAFHLRPLLTVPEPRSRTQSLRQQALGRLRWQVLSLPPHQLGAMLAPVAGDLRGADVIELHWGGWLLPLLPALRRVAPRATIVVVPYDVPWQAYARMASLDVASALGRGALDRSFAAFTRWQVALFQRSDVVLVLKDDDRLLLRQAGVHRPVVLVVDPPLEIPTAEAVAARQARRRGRTVLFTGAFDRPENHRSALWFLDHVWPTVRARDEGARLVIAGAAPPTELRERAAADVVVTGYVDSLAPFYEQADVFVAPLIAGAGLKFKVPQAMMHGLPVVATRLAAEGIADEVGAGAVPGLFGAVTDDPAAMAGAIVELLGRPERCRQLGERGRRWVARRYDFESSTDRVLGLYETLSGSDPGRGVLRGGARRYAPAPMTPDEDSPFSAPRTVDRLDDCRFYHTMELPGLGTVEGPWDLRPGVDDYLGREVFAGRRVLEIGTASGYLCFEMERRGAEVVAFDLTDRPDGWDLVPFGGAPDPALVAERADGMRAINNAWWFAHRALASRARVAYGSVYELPETIGPVDTAVLGAVLLHLRDPFLAMQRALALTLESVIVTEVASRPARALSRLPALVQLRVVRSGRLPAEVGFMPDHRRAGPTETWWRLTPWAVARMLGVLGFDVTRVVFHRQLFQGAPCPMYTVVGHRRPRSGSG